MISKWEYVRGIKMMRNKETAALCAHFSGKNASQCIFSVIRLYQCILQRVLVAILRRISFNSFANQNNGAQFKYFVLSTAHTSNQFRERERQKKSVHNVCL